MKPMSDQSLTTIRALVTRPREQAEALAEAIRSRKGQAWTLPMLEIVPTPETQAMRDTVMSLDQFNRVIVISRHAAHFGMECIETFWPQLPIALDWYAIGKSTGSALEAFDVHATSPDTGSDSESLLGLEAFHRVHGDKILIIKGEGGREKLEQTLAARGAQVECLEVYRRQKPDYLPSHAVNVISKNDINVILAGSGETVMNLKHCLTNGLEDQSANGRRQQPSTIILENCLLVVPSDRIARQSRAMGFNRVYTTEGASNAAMLSALDSINSEESS